MDIQRVAAFTKDGVGGNPAGVVLAKTMPSAHEMQRVAAEIGYSETAFAAPLGEGYRVRYFAPELEVAFCGHATIALGASLGASVGAGRYSLQINDAKISVEAYQENGIWGARLISPETKFEFADDATKAEALQIFGFSDKEMDNDLPVAFVHGGSKHLLLPLKSRAPLAEMSYDFDIGAKFMQRLQLVTVNMIWRETPEVIHSRNAFAGHGVYEDPATGAAAAALAGVLRDYAGYSAPFRVIQGVDMGAPSELWVTPQHGSGAPIEIAGLTRALTA